QAERPPHAPVLRLELLEPGDDLAVDERLGRLQDQPLLVAQPLAREHAVRRRVFDQPSAAAHDRFSRHQVLSKIAAAPMPPPTHMLTRPYEEPRRRSSS